MIHRRLYVVNTSEGDLRRQKRTMDGCRGPHEEDNNTTRNCQTLMTPEGALMERKTRRDEEEEDDGNCADPTQIAVLL